MSRRRYDFYTTPQWATRVLLGSLNQSRLLNKKVIECCVGSGEILNELEKDHWNTQTNDIDLSHPAEHHLNMSIESSWMSFRPANWVITNPPFNNAIDILRHSLNFVSEGVALLLRLSFIEPTLERQNFLSKFPPNEMIVLPRISFTGDGKTDSVTCAWMIWYKDSLGKSDISIVRKKEISNQE